MTPASPRRISKHDTILASMVKLFGYAADPIGKALQKSGGQLVVPPQGFYVDNPEMTATDVLELVILFERNDIEVILDGGWGVDALLGEQTRPHEDLDLAMPHRYVPLARSLLEARGYKDVPRTDTQDCNFVLGDEHGHLVDFHTYTFDEDGNLVFGLPYPPDSLTGAGSVLNHPVQCITPQWLVQFHTGYAFDENDYQDVKALCQRFHLALPEEYVVFEKTSDR